MTNLELTDEEQAALLQLVKQAISTDRYPLSPRLYPLRSLLEKLEPSTPREPRSVPKGLRRAESDGKTETTRWALSL
jgi:hypothetical protein